MTNNEEIKLLPSNRLQFFPIMMFAIVMGFTGLTMVFKKLHEVLYFPHIITSIFTFFSTLIFLIITYIYFKKFICYKEEIKKELVHPIRINFFAAFSISMLLLSLVYKSSVMELSHILFILGSSVHLFLTFYTIKVWINNSFEVLHLNPAWFIPIVGNLIIPVAGIDFVSKSTLYFFFSIGIFFWIILFAIILNRIIFNKQFASKFMPTLFILIAPPAIGFLSYIKLEGSLDLFAHMLYNLGLFFTILIFVMYKNYINIKFFISWWAFTFPMAAITLATLLMYELSGSFIYAMLGYFFAFITSFIVYKVAKETIVHMLKKEICIME